MVKKKCTMQHGSAATWAKKKNVEKHRVAQFSMVKWLLLHIIFFMTTKPMDRGWPHQLKRAEGLLLSHIPLGY